MKLLFAFVSTVLAIGSVSVSAAAVASPNSDAKAKLFKAYKHGDAKSCDVQINFQRRFDDMTTDYRVYSVETKKELKNQIPYDASLQPITVITSSGHGQQGAYQVPGDEAYTYTPFQIDFCGPKGKRYTTYYITGTDIKTGAVQKYEPFALTTPYHFIPGGGPNLSKDIPLIAGTTKTYQASWSYKPQDGVVVKGYYVIFGDKWGKTFDNGDVFPNLGSVYVEGAEKTTAQFTLKDVMDVNRVVLAVSVLDTEGGLLSPTNAAEVSIV